MLKVSIYYLQIIVMLGLAISCKKNDLYTSGNVKINEFMASNSITVADQEGEYDDWIELYNNSDIAIDLSGYYLTDNHSNFKKWEFPSGTQIGANDYLIIWADNETAQSGLHAGFNLSAEGEELLLITPNLKIADYVTYGAQSLKLSYSRIPNGTGSFSWQNPTFTAANVQTLTVSH